MNKINITGEYYFEITFQNMFTSTIIRTDNYHNLITNQGTNFFLNRLISNNDNITALVTGSGTTQPAKNDKNLEKLTSTFNQINKKIQDNKLHITTTTPGTTILNCTEIGVKTDNQQLISRNTHKPIIVPSTATVEIDYIYSFTSGEYKTGWTQTENTTNVYQTSNNLDISCVVESSDIGYKQVTSINEVENTECSYYDDKTSKILYIHTKNEVNPNTVNIMLIYK